MKEVEEEGAELGVEGGGAEAGVQEAAPRTPLGASLSACSPNHVPSRELNWSTGDTLVVCRAGLCTVK